MDRRRASFALADVVEAEELDAEAAAQATRARIEAVERVQKKVVETLTEIHGVLDEEQRQALAYLIRSGELDL